VTQVDDECNLEGGGAGAGGATGVEDLEERARILKAGTSKLLGGNILLFIAQ